MRSLSLVLLRWRSSLMTGITVTEWRLVDAAAGVTVDSVTLRFDSWPSTLTLTLILTSPDALGLLDHGACLTGPLGGDLSSCCCNCLLLRSSKHLPFTSVLTTGVGGSAFRLAATGCMVGAELCRDVRSTRGMDDSTLTGRWTADLW